ncbi:MAG: U32 family peptidase [Brachymonas sp.]|nr:U32 family peptidase [Brachymonas sp.]
MQLALGPVLYYWSREAVLSFYEQMAAAAVDVIYLGEVVCSRRHELRLPDWLALAQDLRQAGKTVVLSTQVLVESGPDASTMRRIAGNGDFVVEANDMGAVQVLASSGQPFVAGPHLNVYNRLSLNWLAEQGAQRWVAPLEMRHSDLALLQAQRPADVQTEVFALGRMPLAFSARCFTARQRNLRKDECGFSCIKHPDGLLLKTREGEDFLVLNGIQTQSARLCNLIHELPALRQMGVEVLRLSPQSSHMAEIIATWRDALQGTITPAEAARCLQPLLVAPSCNGYWHGTAGMKQVHA